MKLKNVREAIIPMVLFVIPHSLLLLCVTSSSVSEAIYNSVMSIIDEINKLR